MFARAKEQSRELTVGITATKASTQPKAKGTKLDDRFHQPPSKRPTSPLNDVLPPEILIKIFKAVILDLDEPAYGPMIDLSLVCRSWREAGRGLELYKVSVVSSKHMDALLGHINTTPLFQERNRAAIQVLSVQTRYLADFYRLPELLALCRTSLRVLHLQRYSNPNIFGGSIAKLLQNPKPEARPAVYFPNLTSLSLTNLAPRELISFLASVDPMKLEHLELGYTYLRFDFIVPELRFPRLQGIKVRGYFQPEIDTIGWLCQIAPNLEMLELSIVREYLPTLTQVLASVQIPKTFERPRIWVQIRASDPDGLNLESRDLAPLVQLITERGWKQWICVQYGWSAREQVYE